MEVIRLSFPQQAADIRSNPVVLAIGEFDGVHLGHREVIARARKAASASGATLAILTFNPHPRSILGQDSYKQLLSPFERRLELFAELGIERVYVAEFNETLMRMSPEQFVEMVLLPLQVVTICVGFDFRFGHKASGNTETLAELANGNFSVEVVPAYELVGAKVSSSAVRVCLTEGDVSMAAELLARRYDLRGTVIHGDGRGGRMLGYPTANLQLDEPYVIPRNGVYAIYVRLGSEVFSGVMNIGFKPTFQTGEMKQTLEAHLFDFTRDIYGEKLTIEFVGYLRSERKFTSIDALIAQIHADSDSARTMLLEKPFD